MPAPCCHHARNLRSGRSQPRAGLLRVILLIEAASFAFAAFVQARYIMDGHRHPEPRIAETAIAIALLIGIGVSVVRPERAGPAGGASQAFALLGTLAEVFTIAIGVGLRTVLHVAYHDIIAAVLVEGIIGARRMASQSLQR